MLSEVDGIKPGTWLNRSVQDRIPNASEHEVTSLLTAVAERKNIQARRLDHAVWAYRRSVEVPNVVTDLHNVGDRFA